MQMNDLAPETESIAKVIEWRFGHRRKGGKQCHGAVPVVPISRNAVRESEETSLIALTTVPLEIGERHRLWLRRNPLTCRSFCVVLVITAAMARTGFGQELRREKSINKTRPETDSPYLGKYVICHTFFENPKYRVCRESRRSPVGANPTRPIGRSAGSNQGDARGNKCVEVLWCNGSLLGDLATMQAGTRVNAEQASKRIMRKPTCLVFREGRRRWTG